MDRSPGCISGMLRLSVLQVNCSRAFNKSSSKMLSSGMHELIRRSRTVRLWTQTWFPVSTEDRVHLVIIPKGTDQTLPIVDGIVLWWFGRCWRMKYYVVLISSTIPRWAWLLPKSLMSLSLSRGNRRSWAAFILLPACDSTSIWKCQTSWVWWLPPAIPALKRLRQNDC